MNPFKSPIFCLLVVFLLAACGAPAATSATETISTMPPQQSTAAPQTTPATAATSPEKFAPPEEIVSNSIAYLGEGKDSSVLVIDEENKQFFFTMDTFQTGLASSYNGSQFNSFPKGIVHIMYFAGDEIRVASFNETGIKQVKLKDDGTVLYWVNTGQLGEAVNVYSFEDTILALGEMDETWATDALEYWRNHMTSNGACYLPNEYPSIAQACRRG